MNNIVIKVSSIIFISFLFFSNPAISTESKVLLKPFTLAKIYKNSTLEQVSKIIKTQLSSSGFRLAGTYRPNKTINIFIITSPNTLKAATKSKFGGFGAGIRVSATQVKNDVQVSHNNPTYMAVAYNMKTYLSSTRKKLAKTLGYIKDFGGKGIPANQLGDYNYAVGLEGFTGFMDLAKYKSHKSALQSVEAGFKKNLKDMKKVYRIDIPGKKQSIFGISLTNDTNDQKFLNDSFVMDIIDSKELRRSAHLPYELMVVGNRVITMHPHYRLAINFPDLHMFGKHSFGQLMDLPYIYEEYLVQLAGGVWPIPDEDF